MQANYANTLCHFNATPLSVAVLAPCAWGESVVCGVAWQSVLLGRNGAWQGALNLATHNTAWRGEFGSETAQHNKIQWHDNKIQHNEFIKASTANGAHSTTDSTKYGEFSNTNSEKRYFMGKTKLTTLQIQHGEIGAVFADKADKVKMEQCLLGEAGKAKMGQCLGRGLLSRCSHFVARLCVKFKGLFYSFHRSFFSSFCLQKAFFRIFCFF